MIALLGTVSYCQALLRINFTQVKFLSIDQNTLLIILESKYLNSVDVLR